MGIWLELGIFGLVFVFAFWQMHDVRKAQAHTREQRAREKAAQAAAPPNAPAPSNPDAPTAPPPSGPGPTPGGSV